MQKVSQIRSAQRLIGAHLLVVEDDFLISMDLKEVLTDAGAEVVGPCRTVIDAVALLMKGAYQPGSQISVSRWRASFRWRHSLQTAESHLSSTRVTLTQVKSEKNFHIPRSFTSRLHLKSWSAQLPTF